MMLKGVPTEHYRCVLGHDTLKSGALSELVETNEEFLPFGRYDLKIYPCIIQIALCFLGV